MANEKVITNYVGFAEKRSIKRTEFFASSMDAFLQDFNRAAGSNDALGSIVAAARIAQLSQAISDEFCGIISELVVSPTEQKVAQQQCSMVVDMLNKNAEQCMLIGADAKAGDTDKGPSPTAN